MFHTFFLDLSYWFHLRDIYTSLGKAEGIDDMTDVRRVYTERLEEQYLLLATFKPIQRALISIFNLTVSCTDAHTAYTS